VLVTAFEMTVAAASADAAVDKEAEEEVLEEVAEEEETVWMTAEPSRVVEAPRPAMGVACACVW
jgi:hypothetical protein